MPASAESSSSDPSAVADEDLLRADVYGLLAAFLRREPEQALLAQAASLSGDDSELGQAFSALASRSRTMSLEQARS